ncbi:MAG: SecD/SecF fusion protein, partial [Sphingobacteriales bacterium]
MQNKSAVWLFAILLTLACLYQISFSWVTSGFEDKAASYGQDKADSLFAEDQGLKPEELDSIQDAFTEKFLKDNGNTAVYPVFGYTYQESKEKEINLGLDLKGGMSVTLEVSIPELVVALSGNSKNEQFRQAIAEATNRQSESQADFITLFSSVYDELYPDGKLAAIFHSRDNREKFPREATNSEIVNILRLEAQVAIDNTEKILRTRIDKFGVTQPTIQKQQYSGRILIELPGVKDKSRVRKILQSTANLEFWETYGNEEVYGMLDQANLKLASIYGDTTNVQADDSESTETDDATTEREEVDALLGEDNSDSTATEDLTETQEDFSKTNPLFSVLYPSVYQDQTGQFKVGDGPVVGIARVSDTAQVNRYLADEVLLGLFPATLRFVWSAKPDANNNVTLHALKVTTRDGNAPLDGSVIVDAKQDFDFKGDVEVTMQMNGEGAGVWASMTSANIGNAVAIVLD